MTTPDQPCHLAGMHPADCPAYVAGLATLRERLTTVPIRLTPQGPRDRGICGICGTFAPTLFEGPTPICTLMAEHPGWHGDREGMSWAERTDTGPDTAYERGIFDAGVAEGRRQATEGWEREWGTRRGRVVSVHITEGGARRWAVDVQTGSTVVSRLVGPWEPEQVTVRFDNRDARYVPADPPVPLFEGDEALPLLPADVEVFESRSAGWVVRCHPCDITNSGLDEVVARLRAANHVALKHAEQDGADRG